MKKTLYFVRHCEYKNPDDINPGRNIAVELEEVAVSRMKKDSKYFLDKEISDFYTSPVQRAVDTSEIIKEVINKEFIQDKRLSETNIPLLEGKTHNEIQQIIGTSSPYTNKNHLKSGGETYYDILSRMKEITKISKDQSIIVSHGDPLAILFYYLRKAKVDLNKTMRNQGYELYPPRGSITKIILEDEFELLEYNKVNY